MADWPSKCSWVKDELKKRNADELAIRIEKLREKAIPELNKITETFSEYTIHDVRHKDSVCEILGWLIPRKILEDLSAYDIYFLVAATYIHDIGMADIKELFDEKAFVEWVKKKGGNFDQSEHRREFIREFHHLRSKQFIQSHYKDYFIDNPTEAEIITTIAKGHRKLDELKDFVAFPRKCMYGSNISINIAALAYYLQLADELDLTFERAPLSTYKHFPQKNTFSAKEWEKSLSISGIGLDRNDKRKILVTAFCKDRTVHQLLLSLESKIQYKLDMADQIIDAHNYNYFPSRILFDIKKEGYEAIDLEIVFEMKSMIPLLSEKIYTGREQAIREFIQNSIDACRRRQLISERQKKDYSPQIVVRYFFQDGRPIVSFEDNGEGMDENILSNYFGKIGRSYYKSPEFAMQNPEFRPISEFGIGVLSGFMLADSIIIDTKTEESNSYHLELFPSDRRILATNGTRSETGSMVILPLKSDVQVDLVKELKKYTPHVEIPIRIETPEGAFTIEPHWLGAKDIMDQDVSEIRIELSTEAYHGLITFPASTHPTLGLLPIPLGDEEYPGRPTNTGRLSRRGIFVEWLSSTEIANSIGINGTLDIDILAGSLEVDAGRTTFKRNENFERFIANLQSDISSKLRELLNGYLAKDPDEFRRISINLISKIVTIRSYPNDSPIYKLLVDYVYVDVLKNNSLHILPLSSLGTNIECISGLPPVTPTEMYHMIRDSNCSKVGPMVLTRKMEKINTILGRKTPWRQYSSLFSYTQSPRIEIPYESEEGFRRFPYLDRITFLGLQSFSSRTKKLIVSLLPVREDRGSRYSIRLTLFINLDHPLMAALAKELPRARRTILTKGEAPVMDLLVSLLEGDIDAAMVIQRQLLEHIGKMEYITPLTKDDVPNFILPPDATQLPDYLGEELH